MNRIRSIDKIKKDRDDKFREDIKQQDNIERK